MDIKAYDFFLRPHDMAIMHILDGIATLVTDENHPPSRHSNSIWDKTTGSHKPNGLPHAPDRIAIPTWEVLKEDFEANMAGNIPPLLESGLDKYPDGSIYIFRRDWGDIWEVGLCFYGGHGTLINEYATGLIEQYMKLKAFW